MFDGYVLVMAAPLLAAATNVLVHLGACRCLTRRGAYFKLLAGFIAGLPVVLVISLVALSSWDASFTDRAALLALNLLTYLGLAFGYFSFVNLNIASLRIRICRNCWQRAEACPATGSWLATIPTRSFCCASTDCCAAGT